MFPDELKARLLEHKKTSALGTVLGVISGVALPLLGGAFDVYAKIVLASCALAGTIGLLFAKD